MPTRAAARREAALLQSNKNEAALSSPPAIPSLSKPAAKTTKTNNATQQFTPAFGKITKPSLPRPTPGASARKKHAPAKSKKKVAVEDGDILPHGLGRASDWDLDGPKVIAEDQPAGIEYAEVQAFLNSRTRKRKQPGPPSHISLDGNVKADPVTAELLETKPTKKRGGKLAVVKRDEDVLDEEYNEGKGKRKHAFKKPAVIDTSDEVVNKVEHLEAVLDTPAKKQRKKKTNKYGLTPGETPFPNFDMPTPEACEEVNRLLTELHGEYKPPAVVPPPSMTVTGCGEVPDLLEAILRTLLSASTTANNANMAFDGLVKKFGRTSSSSHTKSLNWEGVRQADLETVIDAIKRGGLAQVKGINIKKILDTVYNENCARQDALLERKKTGKKAAIAGASHESKEAKEMEMSRSEADLLSLDHIFDLTTEEAMEEMTKLPGIGVKTASCVILFCMKRPSFAVDTHVWRHCKWLGWVPPKATRDQTFSHCEVRVPDHLKYSLHQLFLQHGKKCPRCRANTSAGTEEWEGAVCPIEHLVNRNEKRKQLNATPAKKVKSNGGGQPVKKGRKSKKAAMDDETEESEVELGDDNKEEPDEDEAGDMSE